jgi:dipeptidase E
MVMKLYLSSYRFGDRFSELVEALPTGARIAVVSNALDNIPAAQRAAYARSVFDPLAAFNDLGFSAYDLDLRNYFDRQGDLESALSGTSLVFATGGSAFLLRRAMRQSGFDDVIMRRMLSGDLIYGGWSAGACVAGSDLFGLDLMDDHKALADGYDAPTIWEGLGLLDYCIVPHYRSEHAESAAADQAIAKRLELNLPLRALGDGQVVVV